MKKTSLYCWGSFWLLCFLAGALAGCGGTTTTTKATTATTAAGDNRDDVRRYHRHECGSDR